MPPRRALALAVALTTLAAATSGCGEDDRPLPAACVAGVKPIAQALSRAPAAVRLSDDTKLSTCVERARSDADIQTVGIVFTREADRLAADLPTSDRAALQLGYLTAAVRKGAAHTSGIHAELVRRIGQAAGIGGPPPARRAAFDAGLRAGERDG
jgi:hypothetical protein